MNGATDFFLYLFVCASVTYLVRMLPLVFIRKKIKNRFVISFLYYMPYSILSVMTIPAIFYSTNYLVSAIIGFAVGMFFAYLEQSMVLVAAFSCTAVLIVELIIRFLF